MEWALPTQWPYGDNPLVLFLSLSSLSLCMYAYSLPPPSPPPPLLTLFRMMFPVGTNKHETVLSLVSLLLLLHMLNRSRQQQQQQRWLRQRSITEEERKKERGNRYRSEEKSLSPPLTKQQHNKTLDYQLVVSECVSKRETEWVLLGDLSQYSPPESSRLNGGIAKLLIGCSDMKEKN